MSARTTPSLGATLRDVVFTIDNWSVPGVNRRRLLQYLVGDWFVRIGWARIGDWIRPS